VSDDQEVSIVVVGGSWGGLVAAVRVLHEVPSPLSVPVLLVLHRSRSSERALLERVLTRDTGHPARELVDKDDLTAGTIHLAPADYHVLVEGGSVSLSVEGPVNHSRPSVDLAFETAAEEHGAGMVAVLLSGLGRDGARGIVAVRRHGGRTLVQDPDDADRPDMPLAAIATGAVDEVVASERIGARLGELVGGTRS
jgi:two-component system, chemotaxis family, protein-glutamate methylesterase/glutaminase